MPPYWYSARDCKVKDEDDTETVTKKQFNLKIVASRKPYFMTYVYPKLKRENDNYVKNNNRKARWLFGHNINELEDLSRSDENIDLTIQEFLKYYHGMQPVSYNPCIVNRIAWLFEKEFENFKVKIQDKDPFDYSFLKSGVEYSQKDYQKILNLYSEYVKQNEILIQKIKEDKCDKDFYFIEKSKVMGIFKSECEQICPNKYELCDIVLDICYGNSKSKQFAWDVSGDTILENLLVKNDYIIRFPVRVKEDGEFSYCGENFSMAIKKIGTIE